MDAQGGVRARAAGRRAAPARSVLAEFSERPRARVRGRVPHARRHADAAGRTPAHEDLAMAMFLTLLVGASRVYLGVHYPTDVLAGWIVGLFWASICWLVERRLERRADVRAERRPAANP
ncbi:MAG: hypothetical protein DMF86_20360 [Acidobacteria bacterium]|nr:MAG: hypothetical protein DMF86_20360 [Acidobacteriota bacterium]